MPVPIKTVSQPARYTVVIPSEREGSTKDFSLRSK